MAFSGSGKEWRQRLMRIDPKFSLFHSFNFLFWDNYRFTQSTEMSHIPFTSVSPNSYILVTIVTQNQEISKPGYWDFHFLSVWSHFYIHGTITAIKIRTIITNNSLCYPFIVTPFPTIPKLWQPLICLRIYNFVISRMLYKWNYTVCGLLRLMFFTQHNTLEIQPNYCIYQKSLPFYC